MAQVYGLPLSGHEDAFTRRRRTGIGGSDAAAILGVSPWKSKLGLWQEKRGISIPDPIPGPRLVWGQRLERTILQGYSEDHNRPIRFGGRQFRRSARYPWMIGHPDAEAEDRIVEAKATDRLDERWGEDGSDDVPAHYYAQVQHYMILREMPLADITVLVRGNDPHTFEIPADPAFQEALLEEERSFWQAVKDGIPPEPDGSEDAARALRLMFPRAIPEEIVATPEIASLGLEWLEWRSRKDEATAEEGRLAAIMQSFMGSRERLIGTGFRATWGNVKGSVSWKDTAGTYRELLEKSGVSADALDRIREATRGADSRRFSVERKAIREEAA